MWAGSLLIVGLIHWESGIVPAVGAGTVAAALLMMRQSGKSFGTPPFSSVRATHKISMEDPVQTSVEGQQAARRGDCNPIAAVISDAKAAAEPSHGWVVCRSMNGLCLSVEAAVENGAVLSVRPAAASEAAPWVQVKVEACRPGPGGWELVCRFLKPPTWASVNGFFS